MSYDQFQDIGIYFDLNSEPPDVRGDNKQRTQTIGSQATLSKKGRISNNSFKSPLRLLINIILNLESSQFLRSQVKLISKEKNLQTFPKLICFCQRQGLRSQISQIWSFEIQKYLSSKKQALTQEKYKQIQKWTNRMSQSLAISDWNQFIRVYWGNNVRHKDKLARCISEIQSINSYQY